MFRAQNLWRAVSGVVIITLCQPFVAPLFGQAQPMAQLVEVIEYYDKAKADWDVKNLAAAKETCRDGLRRLGRVPDNEESRRIRGRFEPLCRDVNNSDKQLESRANSVRNLTGNARLESARSALDGIEEFSNDARHKDVAAKLQARMDEFKRALKEAEDHEGAHHKKSAHNAYKRAQSINKEAGLQPKIQATNGCYAGCKSAIWMVVLAAGGAGTYYGYKEYEKRKK